MVAAYDLRSLRSSVEVIEALADPFVMSSEAEMLWWSVISSPPSFVMSSQAETSSDWGRCDRGIPPLHGVYPERVKRVEWAPGGMTKLGRG